MPLDTATSYGAIYDRAATDTAGAAVRALLGTFPTPFPKRPEYAGQRAVFSARFLDTFRAVTGVTLPWLVWRQQGIGGQSGGLRDLSGSWFIYAPRWSEDSVLNTIADAVERLYGSEHSLALAGGRYQVSRGDRPFEDRSLELAALEVRLTWRTRG
jgi:hypothetical protein